METAPDSFKQHVHQRCSLLIALFVSLAFAWTSASYFHSLRTQSLQSSANEVHDHDQKYENIAALRAIADAALKSYLTREHMSSDDGWTGYRLGDMFLSPPKQRGGKNGYSLHKQRFPLSIATEYMERDNATGSAGANYTTLLQIVQKRTAKHPELVQSNTTLAVHLRLGDVIDRTDKRTWYNASYTAHDFLHGNIYNLHGNIYVYPLSHYQRVLDLLEEQHIKIERVLLITGFHYETYHLNTYVYLNEMLRFFKSKGFSETELRINESPDDDVIVIANSKHFVKAGGGYSNVLAHLVNMTGDVVW